MSWSPESSISYATHGFLFHSSDTGIDGTLQDVPVRENWNVSLWTLPWELGCYVVIGILLGVAVLRRRPLMLCSALLVTTLVGQTTLLGGSTEGFRLAGFFTAGVLVWVLRNRLQARWMPALACAMVIGAMWVTLGGSALHALAPLPMAYLLLALGALLPTRIGSANDMSYGVYI